MLRPEQSSDLLVASGGGVSVEEAAEKCSPRWWPNSGAPWRRTTWSRCRAATPAGSPASTSGVGWAVGAYLFPTVLGLARGGRPRSARAAAIRLAVLVPYALASGFGGAFIVGPMLDAQTGHFWKLGLLGAAVSFSIAAVAIGLEALLGVVGSAVALLVIERSLVPG